MTLEAKATIIRDLPALRARVAAWHADGETVALVPTMGALHDGHMELAREGKRRADRVILTIFVNPTQFAPNEDFSTYPRSLAADCARFDTVGGDLVYAPSADEIYPSGFATTVRVAGPAAVGLEDRFRPTHFAGVATIVAKLLIQAQPDVALFGEKDFQQLCVIRQMTRDLDLPVAIIGVPVVRDSDGLALSSRNVYLDVGDRMAAPRLFATLKQCADAIARSGSIAPNLAAARAALNENAFIVDYLEARHIETLLPLEDGATSGRILAAARLGRTRLIDNVAIARHDGEIL